MTDDAVSDMITREMKFYFLQKEQEYEAIVQSSVTMGQKKRGPNGNTELQPLENVIIFKPMMEKNLPEIGQT